MANALYTTAKTAILKQDAGLDFAADTFKVSLVDTADYTVNLSTHDFYNDLAGVESTATLSSLAVAAGKFDSADPTFSAPTGDPCEALVLWSDTGGASSTDPLVAYYDTATGLPMILNGGNIAVSVHADGWLGL